MKTTTLLFLANFALWPIMGTAQSDVSRGQYKKKMTTLLERQVLGHDDHTKKKESLNERLLDVAKSVWGRTAQVIVEDLTDFDLATTLSVAIYKDQDPILKGNFHLPARYQDAVKSASQLEEVALQETVTAKSDKNTANPFARLKYTINGIKAREWINPEEIEKIEGMPLLDKVNAIKEVLKERVKRDSYGLPLFDPGMEEKFDALPLWNKVDFLHRNFVELAKLEFIPNMFDLINNPSDIFEQCYLPEDYELLANTYTEKRKETFFEQQLEQRRVRFVCEDLKEAADFARKARKKVDTSDKLRQTVIRKANSILDEHYPKQD